MKHRLQHVVLALLWLIAGLGCERATDPSQDTSSFDPQPAEWTAVHQTAWDVVAGSPLVTLITLDASGHPQARILESIPPDSGRMDVWMGTNVNSAKVTEIRSDPRATLFYQKSGGYVTLRGQARIVDDPAEKERRWRPHWEAFYPDPEAMYVLIHFVPDDGEIVSFSDNLEGDSLTWAAPEFSF